MACYNCGYEVSVVSKDDIGWLCEWCSDNDLRSPVIKRLKKRIEEFESYKDGKGIVIKLDADKNYEVVDISEHILLELQKCMVENNEMEV